MIADYKKLEDSVRNSYGSVVWSHKIQEKQADIYSNKYKILETISIATASLTSAGIIAIIFVDPFWLKLISAFVSFAAFFVSAYVRSFDLQKSISLHKTTANKLIVVRDQYKLLLLAIKLKKDNVVNLYKEYELLVKRTDEIYAEAPNTTEKAVEQARVALNIKKDNTFSDEEIDSFLPESLRRK